MVEGADATALATALRTGQVSPAELVGETIELIERRDPSLNAVVIQRFEEAMAEARACRVNGPDGSKTGAPFAGVPIVLKDLGAVQAGQPLYLGNRALKEADHRARADNVLGSRFREAGFITVGRANTAEMGAQTTTQPLSFGPTRNPWDLQRSPGGSSGGSAAAVAAGLVPVAHGNDGLGSIRLPAAWCGVVGFKPSRGRVPIGATSVNRMTHEFVITRSVRDAAAVLDCLSTPSMGELYTAPAPRTAFAAGLREAPSRLRIGVLSASLDAVLVEPEIVAAVEDAAVALEALGHDVEQDHPPALFEDCSASLQPDRPSDHRRRIRSIGALLGRPATADDVEPYLWAMAHAPTEETVDSYIQATDWQQSWAWRVLSWWIDFDLLLCPTVPVAPETLTDLEPPRGDPTRFFDKMRRHIMYTSPFNVTGQPAIALPWGEASATAPPASIQLVGAPGRDDVVLALAHQLQPRLRPSVIGS